MQKKKNQYHQYVDMKFIMIISFLSAVFETMSEGLNIIFNQKLSSILSPVVSFTIFVYIAFKLLDEKKHKSCFLVCQDFL